MTTCLDGGFFYGASVSCSMNHLYSSPGGSQFHTCRKVAKIGNPNKSSQGLWDFSVAKIALSSFIIFDWHLMEDINNGVQSTWLCATPADDMKYAGRSPNTSLAFGVWWWFSSWHTWEPAESPVFNFNCSQGTLPVQLKQSVLADINHTASLCFLYPFCNPYLVSWARCPHKLGLSPGICEVMELLKRKQRKKLLGNWDEKKRSSELEFLSLVLNQYYVNRLDVHIIRNLVLSFEGISHPECLAVKGIPCGWMPNHDFIRPPN